MVRVPLATLMMSISTMIAPSKATQDPVQIMASTDIELAQREAPRRVLMSQGARWNMEGRTYIVRGFPSIFASSFRYFLPPPPPPPPRPRGGRWW